MIIDKLIDKIVDTNNPTCIGLDTHLGIIPESFAKEYDTSTIQGAADAIFEYNRVLVDTLYKYIPSVKIQNAYYEMYGLAGIEAYAMTIKYAKSAGLVVIADVKRGDIGSTCTAYSRAHLDNSIFGADFMTINPYFGTDGMQPFIDDCQRMDKGVFVLVKTSNPTSSQLQDLIVDGGETVYEKCADIVIDLGADSIGVHGYNAIGAVVGATHPQQGIDLRSRMANTFFLIPGYGAQGAGVDDIVGMFDSNGIGGIVNSSRGIIGAWQKAGTDDFAGAALDATLSMRDDIDRALNSK